LLLQTRKRWETATTASATTSAGEAASTEAQHQLQPAASAGHRFGTSPARTDRPVDHNRRRGSRRRQGWRFVRVGGDMGWPTILTP